MDTEETFFLALKIHRESKGIEIDEISDYTKINPKYLNAIEEGNFNIIPNIYMRLFIRSYTKYIGADSEQALVDYELHTTGKVQPKFFENEQEIEQKKTTQSTTASKFDSNDDFQINYTQVIMIALTIIAIYSGFKLVSYLTTDNLPSDQIEETPSSEISVEDENNIEEKDLSLLTNKTFKNSVKEYEITEILPLKSNDVSFIIQTLDKTKINIATHNQDGSVFFLNNIFPKDTTLTFLSDSLINFDILNSSHVKISLNELNLSNYIPNENFLIRGSYRHNINQFYVALYKVIPAQ